MTTIEPTLFVKHPDGSYSEYRKLAVEAVSSNLSTLRPERASYPESLGGDMAFNQALVTWQYSEIERLRAERNMYRDGWDQKQATLRAALINLECAHNGYQHGMGPCICAAHEDARAAIRGAPETGVKHDD